MKNQILRFIKKNILILSVALASISGAGVCGYSLTTSNFIAEAASQNLAKFKTMRSANRHWKVVTTEEGGVGTFRSVAGVEDYSVVADFTDYIYKPGDLLSIRTKDVQIYDEEIAIGYDTSDGSYIKLSNSDNQNIKSQHVGYITIEFPRDTEGIFKDKNPTLVRIRGKRRNSTSETTITFNGFEIHRAGTLPSWDDGSVPAYDPYAEPKGISVTYYDGIYSRGFAWSTDESVNESYLYITKKTADMNEDSIDWSEATKVNASMVERVDKDNKIWHIFKAHVLDLIPGASYCYRIGTIPGVFSTVGTFTVAPKTEDIDGLTFLHLTDSQSSGKGNYYRWANVLGAAYAKFPSAAFVANSGDLTNDCNLCLNMYHWIWGLDAPASVLRNVAISPSSGNHDKWGYSFTDRFDFNYADYISDSDAELKSGGCYYYTYGSDILFINLNTNEYSKTLDAQIDWCRNILEEYKDYKWKVVQMHIGPMSTGDVSNNQAEIDFRNRLCPIFSKYKVDLVLQGHDHVYTRTASYPFWTEDNDDETMYTYEAHEEAGVVSDYSFDGETRLWNLEPEGTHYVTINYTSHKAGYPITDLDERIHIGKNPIAGNSCSSQPEKTMYGVVRIKGNILCYDAYTYDNDTKESKLYDTFSVDKSKKEAASEEREEDNKNKNESKESVDSTNNDIENHNDSNNDGKINENTESSKEKSTISDKSKSDNTVDSKNKTIKQGIRKNMIVTDKKTRAVYKVLKVTKKNGKLIGGSVIYVKPIKKNYKKITVPSYIKIDGKKFYVTKIGSGAFKGCKNLRTVTIGINVTRIGSGAFKGCSKLKSITIKSKKLNKIGTKAFSGINKKAKIKVPKNRISKYIILINNAKAPKSVKITK